MSSQKIAELQQQINQLLDLIREADLDLHAVWNDEYGGLQSIIIGIADRLIIQEKNR